jgi:hypothetical protein
MFFYSTTNHELARLLTCTTPFTRKQRRLQAVKNLCQFGADVNSKMVNGGWTALDLARKLKNKKVTTYLTDVSDFDMINPLFKTNNDHVVEHFNVVYETPETIRSRSNSLNSNNASPHMSPSTSAQDLRNLPHSPHFTSMASPASMKAAAANGQDATMESFALEVSCEQQALLALQQQDHALLFPNTSEQEMHAQHSLQQHQEEAVRQQQTAMPLNTLGGGGGLGSGLGGGLGGLGGGGGLGGMRRTGSSRSLGSGSGLQGFGAPKLPPSLPPKNH